MRAILLMIAVLGCVGGGACGGSRDASPDGSTAGDATADAGPAAPPRDLRDTGLYSDWGAKTVAPANRAYAPAFSLYSDGAAKSRWIALPPGTQIDVTNPDEWTFPVGTKLWKEFRLDVTAPDGTVLPDQRIETRLLWKQSASDWTMVTYVWSADQTNATLALETAPPPIPFPGTTDYEVPVLRCHQCHDGRADKVLGFDGALLAAPEADQTGLTWAGLQADGLVGPASAIPAADAMQFLAAGTPVERAAIGYLHVNCGIACHNADAGTVAPFFMRLEAKPTGAYPTTIDGTAAFQTAVNVASQFVPSGDPTVDFRIRPTDPTRSTLVYRMNVRTGLTGGGAQMPPIASHVIDATGLATIDAWILAMTAAPYPAPSP